MASATYPGSTNAFREQWPWVSNTDGIVGDYTGTAFGLTTSGSAPTVTISPGTGGIGVIRTSGFALALDAPITLDLSTVGTQPTGTQKRVDLIVARYDWSVTDPNLSATIAVRPGAPTAASTALDVAAPVPTQIRGSIWEVPLHVVSRVAGGVVTVSASRRTWAMDMQLIAAGAPLLGPIGALRIRDDDATWYRQLAGTTPIWLRFDSDSQQRYAAVSFASDFTVSTTLRQITEQVTVGAGRGSGVAPRRTLDVHASVQAKQFASSSDTLDFGFRIFLGQNPQPGAVPLHDQTRKARLRATAPDAYLFQQFDLAANQAYTVQLVGRATGGVAIERDRAWTSMTVIERDE